LETDVSEKVIINIEEEQRSGLGGQGIGHGWGGISLTHKGSIDSTYNYSKALKSIFYSRLEELAGSSLDLEDVVKSVLTEINYYSWINSYDLAFQRGELTEGEWFVHQNVRTNLVKEIREHLLSLQVRHENSWKPVQRQYWLYKPLLNLTEEEKAQVKESIRKWVRKLAVRPGGRWKSSPKGTIDLTRIVQQSIPGDGKVFHLSYRRRIQRMSELVVLCDVSNSVAAFVEFLIYMVRWLRARIRKMRVFFFIDSVWEVDRLDWNADPNGLIQEIKSWGHKASSGYTDYGAVFRELAETKLKEVSSRATVLILGDGKNNYRPAQAEYLAQISEKVRKIFWLNPLDIEEWKERDNVIKHYEDYCTKVYRCRSASDLQRIVQGVF
ncbi:MAG: VWA domain-containing protein, partial [Desulfitobacterium hafniense]|nr:VWA domain-containing protein [Desulfitobacterium hafniense]